MANDELSVMPCWWQDEDRMRGIAEPWRSVWVQREPKSNSEEDRHPEPHDERNRRIAGFQGRDRRP
jgi:hypothetical protein